VRDPRLLRVMLISAVADAVTLSQRINDTGNSVPCYKYKSHKTVIVELEPDLASGELVACR